MPLNILIIAINSDMSVAVLVVVSIQSIFRRDLNFSPACSNCGGTRPSGVKTAMGVLMQLLIVSRLGPGL